MNIISTLPKKTLLLVLFLIFVLCVIFYFLFFKSGDQVKPDINKGPETTMSIGKPNRTNQETPKYRTYFSSAASKFSISFNIPEGFTLPPTIENIEVERGVNLSLANALKKAFNITGDAQIMGAKYVWSSDNGSLYVDTESGFIKYNPTNTASSSKITGDQAIVVADEFLNTVNLVPFTPNTAELKFYAGEGELYETTSPNSATVYEVSYIQSIKGIPIYYHFATPAKITLLIDLFGNIKELKYFNIVPTKTVKTTTLNLDEIKKDVLGGNYQIVNVEGDPETSPSSGEILISSATIIHFDDKKNSTLFPTVLFKGKLQPSGRYVYIYYSVLH